MLNREVRHACMPPCCIYIYYINCKYKYACNALHAYFKHPINFGHTIYLISWSEIKKFHIVNTADGDGVQRQSRVIAAVFSIFVAIQLFALILMTLIVIGDIMVRFVTSHCMCNDYDNIFFGSAYQRFSCHS